MNGLKLDGLFRNVARDWSNTMFPEQLSIPVRVIKIHFDFFITVKVVSLFIHITPHLGTRGGGIKNTILEVQCNVVISHPLLGAITILNYGSCEKCQGEKKCQGAFCDDGFWQSSSRPKSFVEIKIEHHGATCRLRKK